MLSGWPGTVYTGRLLLPDAFGINIYYSNYPGYKFYRLLLRGMANGSYIPGVYAGYPGFINVGAAFNGFVYLLVTIAGNTSAYGGSLPMTPPDTYLYVVGY